MSVISSAPLEREVGRSILSWILMRGPALVGVLVLIPIANIPLFPDI